MDHYAKADATPIFPGQSSSSPEEIIRSSSNVFSMDGLTMTLPMMNFTQAPTQTYPASEEGRRLASLFPSVLPAIPATPFVPSFPVETPHEDEPNIQTSYGQSPENPAADPEKYFAYPKFMVNLQNQLIVFYIEGETRNGVIYPDPKEFIVIVFGPTGKACHIALRMDPRKPCRHMCTFHATEAGAYLIHVQLWHHGVQHIYGSPFNIFVSRNYYVAKPRVILRNFEHGRRQIRDAGSPIITLGCIAVDRVAERIYLTDTDAHQVRAFSIHGYRLAEIHSGSQEGVFFHPTGVAVDLLHNRIVVSDKDNHRICFCDQDGQFISSFGKFGHQSGEFNQPWGVAVSPDGQLIAVADSKNHRLQIFDNAGNFVNQYCAFEINPFGYKNDFDNPRSVCFDNEGTRIYVSDYNRGMVYRFSVDLKEKFNLVGDGRLSRPQGVIVDEAGNIIVCDTGNNCLRIITPLGTSVTSIFGDSTFQRPQSVAILRTSRLLAILDNEGQIHAF